MNIVVIDGMGGKIGAEIIARLRSKFPQNINIMALGTNSVATGKMMKAGANSGASGENSILLNIEQADIILGSLSIIIPNSWMGELTPAAAEAVTRAKGKKILLPLTNPPIEIVGISEDPLPHLMDEAIKKIDNLITKQGGST